MNIEYSKNFKKQYKKLSNKLRERCKERLLVFKENPFARELNNHALHGKYDSCRSINITGDLRAIYEVRREGLVFLIIDTHSNLYR